MLGWIAAEGIAAPAAPARPETEYLTFQVFAYPRSSDPDEAMAFPPSAEIAGFVKDIVSTIGTTGDKRHKLGFTPGPLTFNHTDDQIRTLIRESFKIAIEKNVAVSFHVDDSIFWGRRKDLTNDIANVEWLGWNKTPNTGRRLDWSATPAKAAPMMCLNSPAVRKAVRQRAGLIGTEVRQGADRLARSGKGELFAGVIAGWETMIGRDFATGRDVGYCALSNRGFSAKNPPKDPDGELVKVVKEFMELWAGEMARAGVAKEKIYAHIALPQGFEPDRTTSYLRSVGFAPPEVAFSRFYRAGFSTYPIPGTFEAIGAELTKRGSPPWISAEGTNVIPSGLPGEATMETYLGRMFNHGAVMVDIFSWGIGGEAERTKNIFRLATENKEAIGAYRKFLKGEVLVEREHPEGTFTPARFKSKIERIQKEAPAWARKRGSDAELRPLIEKLDSLIKQSKFQEADKVANAILALIAPN
jgi:hypothetical protein